MGVVSEATAGIEPAMKVLQTSALPLGYVALEARTDASERLGFLKFTGQTR